MKYKNPVLQGCYPDPSVCRVGDDFYLVNSTFEFFPGVPVFHSKNLVQWKQIGSCIDREGQLELTPCGKQNATGIYAPTIRYKDGKFYMITTNVAPEGKQTGNFYVWSEDPVKGWSDPVFLDTPGIDPSLFFDEDGTDYYVGTQDAGIYICPIDLEKGRLKGEATVIWRGTGGSYPEGPHIYRKSGWYYLLISEGGTERCHMITMARSKKIEGPYEACPNNPVLTNRSLGRPIQAVGHADLVEDQKGNWWAVCLGIRTFSYPPKHNLGRETMLVPVNWQGEWPIFGNNGVLEEEIEVSDLPAALEVQEEDTGYNCRFETETLDDSWNFLYDSSKELWNVEKGKLYLKGNEKSLSDLGQYAWVGRRQNRHASKAQVTLEFSPAKEMEEAGITVFMNHRHHYEAAVTCRNGERVLIFRRQIGSLRNTEACVALPKGEIRLEIEADLENYRFYYQLPGEERQFLGQGETEYLTTEVGGNFTGNYFALFAMGNGSPCESTAAFSDYNQK